MTTTNETTERTPRTPDEMLADALSALQAPASVEKSIEQTQREEASDYVQGLLAGTLTNLNPALYTGEAREHIAKAANNLKSALRNAKAAIKKQADPSVLPGVRTQAPSDGLAVLAD